MSAISFKNVAALRYGITPMIGAIQDDKRLWPPTRSSWETSASGNGSTSQEATAFVGDSIVMTQVASSAGGWLNAYLGMFLVQNGVWSPKFARPASGLADGAAFLNGSSIAVLLQPRQGFPVTIDTTGMTPGEYVIAAGDSKRFNTNQYVQLRIHLHPQFPPKPLPPVDLLLASTTASARAEFYANNGYVEDDSPDPLLTLKTVSLPAGREMFIKPDPAYSEVVVAHAMWFSKTSAGNAFWGSVTEFGESDGSMQTRYGGKWRIRDARPGDTAYLVAGTEVVFGGLLDLCKVAFT